MKRILFLMILTLVMMVNTGWAANEDPANWEISMQPKPTAEQIERDRWLQVLENDFGIYYYDPNSVAVDKEAGTVTMAVRTVFTNQKVIGDLNNTYAAKLSKKDVTASCEMSMVFRPEEKTYTVESLQVFSKQGVKLETRTNDKTFVPVPEKTFAEAMLEIAAAAYARN